MIHIVVDYYSVVKKINDEICRQMVVTRKYFSERSNATFSSHLWFLPTKLNMWVYNLEKHRIQTFKNGTQRMKVRYR